MFASMLSRIPPGEKEPLPLFARMCVSGVAATVISVAASVAALVAAATGDETEAAEGGVDEGELILESSLDEFKTDEAKKSADEVDGDAGDDEDDAAAKVVIAAPAAAVVAAAAVAAGVRVEEEGEEEEEEGQ